MRLKPIAVATFFAFAIATVAHADGIEYSNGDKSASPMVSTARLLPASVPLTLTVKDLDANWQYVEVQAAPKPLPQRSGMVRSATFADSIPEVIDLVVFAQPGVYLTQWQTAISGSQSFLITYRVTPLIQAEEQRASFAKDFRSSLPTLFRTKTEFLDSLKQSADERPLKLTLVNLQQAVIVGNIHSYDVKQRDATLSLFIDVSQFEETPDLADFQSAKNLRDLMWGATNYIRDNDGKFPPMRTFDEFKKIIAPRLGNQDVLFQPKSKTPYAINQTMSRKRQTEIKTSYCVALIYETQTGNDGKRAVLFADGHFRRVNENEWAKIKKESGIQ